MCITHSVSRFPGVIPPYFLANTALCKQCENCELHATFQEVVIILDMKVVKLDLHQGLSTANLLKAVIRHPLS